MPDLPEQPIHSPAGDGPPPTIELLAYQPKTAHVPEGWTNVSTHGIRPEMAHMEWRRTLAILLVVTVPTSLSALGLMVWLFRDNWHEMRTFLLIWLPVMFLSMSWRFFRMWRLFKKRWPSFRIVVADQGIVRSRFDLPDIIVPMAEIRDLREFSAGMYVRGKRRVDLILVPRSLEEYAEVRAKLGTIRPIRGGGWQMSAFAITLSLLQLACYITGLLTSSHELRWGMIVVLTMLTVWSLVRSLRSPNLTLSQKLLAPVVLIMPVMLVVMELLG